MLNRGISRGMFVATAITVASIAGGTAYASFAGVSATATDTVAAHTSGGINLSSVGGVKTSILSMSLPAGKYVISAEGDLVSYGPSDYTRCNIVVKGSQIAAVSTVVGDPTQAGNVGPSGLLSPVALTGGVTVGSGGTATLQCWHDDSNGAQPYFDVAGSMWAHKTGSLSTPSF